MRAEIVGKVHLDDLEKKSASAQLDRALREDSQKNDSFSAEVFIAGSGHDVLAVGSEKPQDQEDKHAEVSERHVMTSRSLLATTFKEKLAQIVLTDFSTGKWRFESLFHDVSR